MLCICCHNINDVIFPPGQWDAKVDWTTSSSSETNAGETTLEQPESNILIFNQQKFELGLNVISVVFVQECAKRIAKVSADAKLEVDEETYLNQFKPHLMDVVFAWANGATFAQICKMTDVFEGVPLMLMSNRHDRKLKYSYLSTILKYL